MAKSRTSKKDRRKRKIVIALIMVLFVGVVLTASTYAWFTANRQVKVESIDVQVSTSKGLQISTDANTWKSIITKNDITGVSTQVYSAVKNQIPSGLSSPVSTIGTVDGNGLMQMYKGVVESGTGGGNVLVSTKSTETNGTGGDFVAFDLFVQSSEEQTVYLTSNSNVVAPVNAQTQESESTGIEYAARVAFIPLGHVAFGTTPAQAQALKTEDNGNPKWIWEPNYDVHTESGVSNALNVYNKSTTTTGASKLTYLGVKDEFALGDNVALNSDDEDLFGSVTTVETAASGIPTSHYLSAFKAYEGVTKVRIYMWIEGQDVDCEDHASGGSVIYNLQFSIDDKAPTTPSQP